MSAGLNYYILVITFIILGSTFREANAAHEVEGKCLPGRRHKAKPGREDDSYKACLVFKNNSCCTSEFTNQLADKVVRKIGNFSWTLCGDLSPRCQEYMVGVECFYSCSPFVGLWGDPEVEQSFNNAPVCSSYCDQWYDACKNDMTCAKNWAKDFDYVNNSNVCKRNCTTFKELYANGKDLCESLWDDSFKYTDDTKFKDKCLHFSYNSSHNPNKDVVENIFGHSRAQAAQSCILGVTLAVIFWGITNI